MKIISSFLVLKNRVKKTTESFSAISMTIESTILLLIGVLVAIFLIYWLDYIGGGEVGSSIGTRIFQAFTD